MLTSIQIGNNGRLGNQLFQFSALYSAGFTRGYNICIPTNQELTETFEMNGVLVNDHQQQKIERQYREPSNEFHPGIFMLPDNTDINGYFQSPMYFSHVEEPLRKILSFKNEILLQASSKMRDYQGQPVCSLHIRRGDYLNLSNFHKNLESDYYNHAISIVRSNVSNARFIVFSDDPAWCKKNMPSEIQVDDSNQQVSLCMMSMCPIHIIANSSFSWWGAWLSGSRAVVAPKQWFAPDGPKTWQTIYMPHWVVI